MDYGCWNVDVWVFAAVGAVGAVGAAALHGFGGACQMMMQMRVQTTAPFAWKAGDDVIATAQSRAWARAC